MRRAVLRRARSAAAMFAIAPAGAQPAPGTVHVLRGHPPGGSVDIVAPRLAGALAAHFDRAAIVDNRLGAAERIAAEALCSSSADGSALLVTPDRHRRRPCRTGLRPACGARLLGGDHRREWLHTRRLRRQALPKPSALDPGASTPGVFIPT